MCLKLIPKMETLNFNHKSQIPWLKMSNLKSKPQKKKIKN